MSLISVVTTFHNASETLPETIRSLQAQTHADYEHLLIDDGSDDLSVEIIREVGGERVVLIRPGRVGRVEALNIGLNTAQGKYVAILDADDIAKPDRLMRQKAMLDEDVELTLVCANADLIDEEGMEFGTTCFPESHIGLVTSLMNLNPFPHSSVMFQRETALAIGGYNVRCEKSIDYNFYLDLLISGGKFAGCAAPLITLRSYPDSWGKNDQRGLQIRYGILGLINYFQESNGIEGILRSSESDWPQVKSVFDKWFDNRGYQQQMEAKKIFSNALKDFKYGRLLKSILDVKDALIKDPWLWKYRGCAFRYPDDVLVFLSYLKHKQCDLNKRMA
ncbi:MAG: glycosyltransferase [Desulfobulbaceae bacterium]|nr:glycosyltransferase [Desulfobulbaceae bacterium]